MREGIHRDGRQLYPAFPYTHFARTSDADLQALYAYLMAQSPVRAEARPNALAFPFNWRPLLAGGNALFHQPKVFQADATKSEVWNRGAYLVEGLGHCSACHSPRNAPGAERAAASVAGRLSEGAGAVCHEVGGAPLFGSRPSLALNSNLHSAHPDNLVQVILHGIAAPASSDLGYMPAFKDSFTDGQVAELASYLRRQFAPDKPAWTEVNATVSRLRQDIAR